ncbi:WD40/YVTN/BNR-like repeat-containing protein [Chitinophaga vietnamensis]|uniref:WD40/YVTN/BNR-like repeat-containing protein n=1 Tax=Chitinophaga vietnamensis TaxID=2593957 RepID=UPI001177E6AE|nr:oxidoreductase [Chitinophaga vietnamensis]
MLPLLAIDKESQAQSGYHINIISPTPVKSIRGLSVVSDDVLWASGTGGMVGRSTDGGHEWQWTRITACDSCDWRSLYAFNAQQAIVINAGEPAHVFRTQDGGQSWQEVYTDTTHGVFFDAIDFFDDQEGIAIGDPLQQRFSIIRTHDGGLSWRRDDPSKLPSAAEGEALFAASGTSLLAMPWHKVYFATGGAVSRFFTGDDTWQSIPLPMIQGKSSTGAFSIAFYNTKTGIAVGGDYRNDTIRSGNCLLTRNGGKSWTAPHTAPGGYKSGVAYITKDILICTGTSGTDISLNGGNDWQKIGNGFNVVKKARDGKSVFLAGKDIAVLSR